MKMNEGSEAESGAGAHAQENSENVGLWRKQRGRVLLQLCGAFVLYWLTLGTDFSDGIIYARLILPRCELPLNDTLDPSDANRSSPSLFGAVSPIPTVAGQHVIATSKTESFPSSSSPPNQSDTGVKDCGGFGEGASQTAWVTSLATAVRVGFAFTGGVFIDACGVRPTVIAASLVLSLGLVLSSFATQLYHVYLTRSVLSGMAAGVLFSVPIHCLALSFDKKIAVASGLAYAGSGVCAIVYGYLGKVVVVAGDWQWYYRMVAAFALLGIPAAFVLEVAPKHEDNATLLAEGDEQASTMGRTRTSCSRVLQRLVIGFRDLFESLKKGRVLYRDVNFILIGACYFLYGLGMFFPYIISSHRSRTLGIESTDAYLQVAYIGFGTTVGDLLFATAGALLTSRATLYQASAVAVLGSSVLLSILITTELGLTSFNIFFSTVGAFSAASGGAVAREVVSVDMTGHAFGHLYMLSAPSMGLGPPVAGWIYDVTQSYTLPLVFGGVVLLLAAVLLFIVDVRIYRQRKRAEKPDEHKLSTHSANDGDKWSFIEHALY
ncbi:monocarboxylate transporter 9-like [Sycon ciliatum]|uniref:monocarboxylate transporter 9-like n=1 Tax=Sycon ciliatum TaxID=27933 RepID=UPI0031F5FF18